MSVIKHCFTSRFPDGVLLEVDFSQLEVVGAAILSGDRNLVADIKSGRDMHKVRAAELYSIPESAVSKDQRQLAKRLSFQLQYGAGAASMAKKNGIRKELAQKFIDQYYRRYAQLKEWQENIATNAVTNRVSTKETTPKGFPRGVAKVVSPTGRMYTFKEYDAPDWKGYGATSFSPTEMKNYPIQGFATADVMAIFRARLFSMLCEDLMSHRMLLINTVHDSVMFDCADEGAAKSAIDMCNTVAGMLPDILENYFSITSHGLTFKVEGKYGPTWGKM